MKQLILIFSVVMVFLAASCHKKSEPVPDVVPIITLSSISPTSGGFDTLVTITGTNFSTHPANNIVMFNGIKAEVQSATATTLKALVPLDAGTGPVSVSTNNQSAVIGPVFTYKIPVITIGTIYPSSGGFDTLVTITGTNFSTTPANNIVKFNGKQAVVQGATANILKVIVPVGAGTGPVSVATNTLSVVNGPVFTYNLTKVLYIAGGIGTNAGYLKNGVENLLPENFSSGVVNASAISGKDLYFAGRDGAYAAYWKNGIETLLPKNPITTYVGAQAMYITPQDIYFGGYDGANAVYWKNGVETTLPKSPSSFYAVAYAMFISGTDVYFAGNDGDNLVYWKNGVETKLPRSLNNVFESVTTMYISGTDVYFAGYDVTAAVYWKNGVEFRLPQTANYGQVWVSAMTVIGTDVYFVGTDGREAAYWKNGIETLLPKTGSNQADASAIIAIGTDIYIAGNDDNLAVYWKNGVEVVLQGNSSKGDMVNTIVSTNE